MTHKETTSIEEEQFKAVFATLLKNPVDSIFPFILRKLNQCNLRNTEPFEVLSEVYERGINSLKSGQKIDNPIGWIWKVTFYVIVHKVRQEVKKDRHSVEFDLIKYKIISDNYEDDFALDNSVHTKRKLAQQAFYKLEPQEQKILDLRLFQKLSWDKVSEALASEGEKIQSNATLRKRGQRATERLRKIYLSLSLDK